MNVNLSPGEWAGVMTCVKEQARALRRDAETDPSVAAADGRERADDLDRIAGVIRAALAERHDVAPDGSVRVTPVVAGCLAAIADVLTDASDPLDVMDAREEAVALLSLLAHGRWGAGTAVEQ